MNNTHLIQRTNWSSCELLNIMKNNSSFCKVVSKSTFTFIILFGSWIPEWQSYCFRKEGGQFGCNGSFWEVSFITNDVYSTLFFCISPWEQKLVLHFNGFNYHMEIWTDKKRNRQCGCNYGLLSSVWINLEFLSLWLAWLLVLILEVRVNMVLLWIWSTKRGLIS